MTDVRDGQPAGDGRPAPVAVVPDAEPLVTDVVDAPAARPLPQPVRPCLPQPTPRLARATGRARQRVAVIIPAKDESRRIAATVRSARAIPHVDLVLVVDDGSVDNTQHVAREAGAVVVRHSHNRGKAAAMETGAAIVAMRDVADRPARLLLFVDGDLGDTAVNTAPARAAGARAGGGHVDRAAAAAGRVPAGAGSSWARPAARSSRPPGGRRRSRCPAALPDPGGVRGGDAARARAGAWRPG